MRPRTCRLLHCAGLTVAASIVFVVGPAASAGLPPLVPPAVLFGNPVKDWPQVSLDAKRLAYLAPDQNGILQIWVQTIGKEDARMVTAVKKGGIHPVFTWTYLPDILLYAADKDGDRDFHLYSVNLRSRQVRDLTPFQGVRVGMLLRPSRQFPNEFLVTLNLEDRRHFDVYRINMATGAVALETKNPGDIWCWVADRDYRIRGAETMPTEGGGKELRYRTDLRSPWTTLIKWAPEDGPGGFIGFTGNGKSVWLESSEGQDNRSLRKRELESGKETTIACDPKGDMASYLWNPLRHEVEAVAFNHQRTWWRALNSQAAADLEKLRKGARGDFSILSFDGDGETWIVSYSADTMPKDYYLYDRRSQKLTHLFASQPELARYTLASMKPVTIKSRDGLELVSYLTLPVGLEAKNLPMILLVHGGPQARDSWGYNAEVQWLANRGYAVLQVNFRGSSGFGKKFLRAGDREEGGKMHDDLIDAVRLAIQQGIADPKRVGIYGTSYGGYAALVGASFTPDVFACAISLCGPSNLASGSGSAAPYVEEYRKHERGKFRDAAEEQKFLKSRSPLFKADHVRIPVLIGQGANDPLVPKAQSDQMVEALRKAGKPVEYLLFPDEGHGLSRLENRLKFYAAMETLLAKHLGGGRFEPSSSGIPAR